MRISVKSDNKYYNSDCNKYYVFLDGEKVNNCFEVDDINGWVMKYKTDENGKVILSKFQDYILFEMLYGKVELKTKEDL